MAPSSDDIARLRRMVNEPNTDTYSDEDLSAAIARYPVTDAYGNDPVIVTCVPLQPPTITANPQWVEGYDLHSAAAEVWEEKAAVVAQDYDFDAPLDDGSYSRSQVYAQYMKQARWHRGRRAAGTIHVNVYPKPHPLLAYGNVTNDPLSMQPPEWGWP